MPWLTQDPDQLDAVGGGEHPISRNTTCWALSWPGHCGPPALLAGEALVGVGGGGGVGVEGVVTAGAGPALDTVHCTRHHLANTLPVEARAHEAPDAGHQVSARWNKGVVDGRNELSKGNYLIQTKNPRKLCSLLRPLTVIICYESSREEIHDRDGKCIECSEVKKQLIHD